jgi:flagellar protein FliO/FliZ
VSYRVASLGLGTLAGSGCALGAAAAGAAAPYASAASAGTAATPGIGSLTQVSLALGLVLALVFALAWLMRRMRGTRRPGAPGIDVLAELALGPKERAVLLQVDRVRLLVGVAAGQVRTLHVLPDAECVVAGHAGAPAPADTPSPNFADLLRRSLGR